MSLTVTIKTPELRYAVKNKTYLKSRMQEAAEKTDHESASLMHISEDEDSAYELSRAITSALADIKMELGEHIDETHTTSNNLIPDAVEAEAGDNDTHTDPPTPMDQIVITLNVPDNFNGASSDAISNGIHDYVVCRSCYAWYRVVAPDIAGKWKEDADNNMEMVKRAIYKRSRPQRPTN